MPVELPPKNPDWIFYLTLYQMVLCAIVINFYTRKVYRFGSGIFSQNKIRQLLADENPFHFRAVYIMMLLALSVISLYSFLALEYLVPEAIHGLAGYGLLFAFFLIFYFGRVLIHLVNGHLFGLRSLASHYILHFFYATILTGILLFPVNILIAYFVPGYTNVFILAGAVIAAMTWLYQLLSGFTAGTGSNRIPAFYMFLYLCAIEILPVAVLSKFLFSTLISVSI